MFDLFIFLIFPALIIFAGAYDFLSMTIPNKLCLAIAALFFPAAIIAGLPLAQIALHASCGLAMLVVGFLLFALRIICAGDAKLFAAASLWFGWALILPYSLGVIMIGGALALAILAARGVPAGYLSLVMDRLAFLRGGREMPYGPALSAAALLIYMDSFWMKLAV